MDIQKELSDISLPITEPEYRARPELSYSTLSTYEKTGYNGLDHLFDKKESPSLTFGSVVDTLLTGSEEEFNNLFLIVDGTITDGGKDVCAKLASMHLPYSTFAEIPQDIVSDAAKEAGFWKADKWNARRYSEVLKTGNVEGYYRAMINAEKTVITSEDYQNAIKCKDALKESPATSPYFADDDIFSPIRRYYQLKFAATFDGVGYRNMADVIVVNYDKKKVFPIDLKTSSHYEWDFEESFTQWNYMIQARLYWRIIRANMDMDPYFKDFTLEKYRFIVVNKFTLTPLVWEFPLTTSIGTLVDDKGNEYRDPFVIGKELRAYLDCKPPVPNGINKDGLNTIKCLKKKD